MFILFFLFSLSRWEFWCCMRYKGMCVYVLGMMKTENAKCEQLLFFYILYNLLFFLLKHLNTILLFSVDLLLVIIQEFNGRSLVFYSKQTNKQTHTICIISRVLPYTFAIYIYVCTFWVFMKMIIKLLYLFIISLIWSWS